MNKFNLGRRHDPDQRDHQYLMASHLPVSATLPVKKLWTISTVHLDQGNTGTCVGHGWRNFLRCEPIRTTAVHPDPFDIYRSAVLLDPWTDNDDEANLPNGDPGMDTGTTVRAGAKALSNMSKLVSYVWAFDLNTMVSWVLSKGPVVIGINWYDSFYSPDASRQIKITPGAQIEGGHCVLIRGANTNAELFMGTNSWGNDWNRNGDFTISFKDMSRLISENAEICTAIQK